MNKIIDLSKALRNIYTDDGKCSKLLSKFINESNVNIKMPSYVEVRKLSSLFYILSNPIRLQIIYLLYQNPLPVCVISKILGVDQTLVSHYLSYMKEEKIITYESVGKFRIYKICEEGLPDEIFSIMNKSFIGGKD